VDIRKVTPDDSAAFRSWYDASKAGVVAGRIDPYFFSYEQMAHAVAKPSSDESFEAYGAFEGDTCVGGAGLVLPLLDNLQLAIFVNAVPPEHRGRGIGTALFEHLGGLAKAAGRSRWYANVRLPADAEENAGSRFAVRHGFTLRNTEIRRQLKVPLPAERMAELDAHAAERIDGYRIVSWVGACPEEYIEQYARLRGLMMTEVPTGDLDLEEEHWDADRVRENERRHVEQGRTGYISMVVAPDGTLAGDTRIYVGRSEPDRAQQGGTLVAKEHRGHRLGLAMKLANLRALLAAEPEVNRIDTENAEQNGPMVAVNVQFGFQIIERLQEYQRDV
jgi:RimJ/RimL family protein N-acetyltransferase